MVLKLLLWISGPLAAIAVMVRSAVLIGLYLGILPGLVLMIAPTLFVYLLAFAVVRRLVPLAPGIGANTLAVGIVIALGVAATLPMALAGRAAFAAAATGIVTPAAPVALAGHIRLQRDGFNGVAAIQQERGPDGKWRVACDALCAALLDTPGVLSVTLAGSNGADKPFDPVTFRLAPPGSAGEARAPFKPDDIVGELPEGPNRPGLRNFEVEQAGREALRAGIQARWGLKLAREAMLVAEPAREGADMTISFRSTRPAEPHRIVVMEASIADSHGRTLFRRQRVTASIAAVPFHLMPEGPMLDRGWGIGRTSLHTGAKYDDIKLVTALFEGTSLARPAIDPAATARMRERLAAAVAGGGSAADLGMAMPWIATLDWQHVSDADADLLAALVADRRVQGLDRIYDGYEKYVSVRLRPAIAGRLLDTAASDQLRNRLNILVRRMPEGTYATLLPEEDALLRNQELRLRTSALAFRLADGGAAAVPRLVALLEADVQVPEWWKRQWMMKDLCRAFTRIGPAAAPALPLVERLFTRRPNPLAYEWREARAWRVAMVRMGKPIETLPFPPQSRPEAVVEDRATIARMAARPFDPDRD